MSLEAVTLSAETRNSLRREFSQLNEVTLFSEKPKLASCVASIGIQREIGTVNDELARFIFDLDTRQVVPRESLKADIVRIGNIIGVKIYSQGHPRLELRAKHIKDLLHPRYSFNADGSIGQLVIFPEIIAKIAKNESVDLVLVKSWGMNSIFGGFDPSKEYYSTNFWELENNDTLKFSDLVQNGRLAFLGTHDLIAHVAGVNAEKWNLLRQQAARVNSSLAEYFKTVERPSIASLIIPYTIGVVLDDLAQPPTYGSAGHEAVLSRLLTELEKKTIPANLPTILLEFPKFFEKTIALSRTKNIQNDPNEIDTAVSRLSQEILAHSVIKTA